MQKKTRAKNSSLKKYIVADRYDGMALEEYLKTVMEVSARQRQKLFFSRGVYVNGIRCNLIVIDPHTAGLQRTAFTFF